MIWGQCPDVLPTSDFSINFCNFPFAWEVTQGENMKIGILKDDATDHFILVNEIHKLVPESEINILSTSDFLNNKLKNDSAHIALVGNQIDPDNYDRFIKAIDYYKNITIVLPAFFGPMDEKIDYSGWKQFVKLASEHGAIIVGAHGDMYQLGDLSFWRSVPVDVFTVMGRKINGILPMKPDFKISENLEESSYLIVGAVALLKSKYPDYTNEKIKQVLKDKGRKVYWSIIEILEEKEGLIIAIPHFDPDYLGKYENNQLVKKIEKNIYEASSLDLMSLFDFNCQSYGGWSLKTLRIEEAQKKATGKNVTVALLDHGFDKTNVVLQGRIVSPHSCIEGIPAFSVESEHGTDMAIALVNVAPDVKIMPVVIFGNGHWGDAEMYIKGIHYAVENGADIISLSHRAIQKENQDKLDEAIQYASDNGVTFVYINYSGDRDEVIISSPVEFEKYNNNPEIIYIIGTNFLNNESPVTWGLSQTAPIVSGVIAMMKEIKPNLTPKEIKQILLHSGRNTNDGVSILDAEKALENLSY